MNVLNGLLAAAVATAAYFTVIPFLNLDIPMSLPEVKATVERAEEKPATPQNYSPVDYAVVNEQNLFHPERKIPPEKKDEKAIPKPEVVLYGTMIMNDTSIAFIEDKKAPYSTQGRGKRQRALKIGDKLSGYILKEIMPTHITLVKGEEKMIVMLNDGQKRKAGATPSLPATPAIATGGSPPAIPPSSSPAVSSSPQAVTSLSPPPTVASPLPGDVVPGARQPSKMEALQMRLKQAQQMRREALQMKTQ